jgi:ribonucleoside-triphosphate reductase (formate)
MLNEIENASQRKTYVGYVYDMGEKAKKEQILSLMPDEWSIKHKDGHIHIHDLDAFGLTYNCLTFNIKHKFPFEEYSRLSQFGKINAVFDYYKSIISKVANEQSGGMGFANFDIDTAEILKEIRMVDDVNARELVRCNIQSLIKWCSESHERMGQVSYYVTLNIGLANDDLSRFICHTVINEFYSSSGKIIKPNIVFKVKEGINKDNTDMNYPLLMESLQCTAKKMIPTYLLCDCELDREYDPKQISIMGCRTRVVDDLYGKTGSIGRGNIDNISINLPRLAMETYFEMNDVGVDQKFIAFEKKWKLLADIVVKILLDRYEKTISHVASDFPTVISNQLWIEDFNPKSTLENVFKHGTLSIGFIGLLEAIEVLTGKKYSLDENSYKKAIEFVAFMKKYIDHCRDEYCLNFSLLATSGEQISGRFEEIDVKYYPELVQDKGFYTNSFHVNVDSGLSAFEKIEKEGPFHKYCNGGCISYIEMGESPIGNMEALSEIIDYAICKGVHYLGFNFPLDVCNDCGQTGVFDICDNCESSNVIHYRRVSGYLEDLSYFTKGKKSEVNNRRDNK